MVLSPAPIGLFSPFSKDGFKFTYKPIAINTNLLAGALTRSQVNDLAFTLGRDVPNKLPSARNLDIIAPWEKYIDPGTLESRMNKVRTLKKFVDTDPRLAAIELALGERTSQKLFALYKALDSLKTVAEYASQKSTLGASLPRLNSTFLGGLQEVQNFMTDLTLDKMSLFFGQKQSSLTAEIGLGKDNKTFTGEIIQTGGADDPLADIVGDEQFTIKMVKDGTTTVNVNINLADITGTISVNSVVAHINDQIALQAPTFQTSFEVIKDKEFDYGIGVSGSSLETVEFVPIAGEPALYIASDFNGFNTSTDVGTLTKLDGVETIDPTRATSTTVAGTDTDGTIIAQKVADAEAAENDEDLTDIDPVAAKTTTSGVASDSQGFVYVLGQTTGDFEGQFNSATGNDVFLSKYDSLGNLVDSRLVGSGGDASAYSIIVDNNDNVIIAGQTDSHLLSTDAVKGLDSFVTKYDSTGKEVFTYQLDTVATDFAASLAVDTNGDVFVGGVTSGAISSTSGFGGIRDGMVLKLDGTSGDLLQSQLLGGAGNEQLKSISIAGNGDVVTTLVEDGNAIVRVLDATDLSVEKYNLSLGNIGSGQITDTYIDNDQLYVVGYTDNGALDAGGTATTINALAGSTDGFVFNAQLGAGSATANYITYLGGTGTDKINDVTFANGNLYVAGGTSDSVNGEEAHGINDSFVASLNATTGVTNYVDQFGLGLSTSAATGVTFVANGSSVLDKLGLPSGLISASETRDIITQSSVRDGDSFFISVNGGAKRRITIEGPKLGNTLGDTINSLLLKINRISTAFLKAEEVTGEFGDTLKLSARNGATIELFSGDKGRDALVKMGLEPGKLMSAEVLANIDPDPHTINDDDLGGVFGLDLFSGLNVADKTAAKFSLTKLETAISTLQRAYRSLVVDPVKLQLLQDAKLKRSVGTAPAYLTARIANFQDALNRLQSSNQQPGSSLFT